MRLDIIHKKQLNRDTDYLYFLLNYVPALVGYKTWRNQRLTSDLDQYFTNSDKAFLLLCYESYGAKWLHDYNATTMGESDDEDTAPGENIPVSERYLLCWVTVCLLQNTIGVSKSILMPRFVLHMGEKIYGSLQGSKHSWNEAGKARFNDLMVEVYNDRKRNGVRFNQRWKKRVAMAFRKKDSSS